jgi:Na+/H+-dicarboxylate symporter
MGSHLILSTSDNSPPFQYSVTVIAGLAFHTIVTIPAIYFLMTRRNPFDYMRGLLPSMLFAFGCSSSINTLPVNFRCLEQMGIDRRITRFVLPVGATINMVGN